MDGADRGTWQGPATAAQLLPDLRRAPIGVRLLQPKDVRFQDGGQLVRMPVRTPTAVREPVGAVVLVPVINLVTGFARDPELGAQRRHLLAVQQSSDEPETLVHHVTLLPGHAPSSGAKCHPCLRNKLLPLRQEGHGARRSALRADFTPSPRLDSLHSRPHRRVAPFRSRFWRWFSLSEAWPVTTAAANAALAQMATRATSKGPRSFGVAPDEIYTQRVGEQLPDRPGIRCQPVSGRTPFRATALPAHARVM